MQITKDLQTIFGHLTQEEIAQECRRLMQVEEHYKELLGKPPVMVLPDDASFKIYMISEMKTTIAA